MKFFQKGKSEVIRMGMWSKHPAVIEVKQSRWLSGKNSQVTKIEPKSQKKLPEKPKEEPDSTSR